jgi:hypothetical protein
MSQKSVFPSREQVVSLPSPVPAAPQESPEDRYVRQVNAMLKDAIECHAEEELADTLSWGLARFVHHYGIGASGDILRRIGGYICGLVEQDRAKVEVEEARQAGRKFQ